MPNSVAAGGMGQPPKPSATGPEKCPLCDARFKDVVDLITHNEQVHNPKNQYKMPEKKVESEKCPHCNTRLAISELPTHLQ